MSRSETLAYPPFFHRELAPGWLAATLGALGHAAPPMEDARYLDIGCGPGYTLCLLAAANPSMRFTGVDPDPTHIAAARALAQEAGLANAIFHETGIDGFLAAAPAGEGFDFIVSHGVYAWVAPPVRASIRRAISLLLKAGGVASLHYMTHPGAAPFAAFHNLFRQVAADREPKAAVEAGLGLLSALKEAEAGFFVAHPAARDTLAHLMNEEPGYIAHEYLGESFTPLHVADVMDDMAATGLHYVGSATPVENIDLLSIPGSVLPLVQREKNPALRETLKDLARNQALRRDLYMRAPRPLGPREHMEALRPLIFASLPGAPESGPLALETRIGPVQAPAAIVTPVLSRLAKGPAHFGELEASGDFARQPGLLNQALHLLMGAGIVHPLPASSPDPAPAERLNAVLLERLRSGNRIPALAFPEIGSALPL